MRHSSLGLEQKPKQLYYSFVRNPSEIAEAQCLRYKVFSEEMGARLSGHDGLDCDGFDAFCDHLPGRDSESGKVVGTYRILSAACGSLSMADGGHMAASLYAKLRQNHLSPAEYRVSPRCPLTLQALPTDMEASCPALLEGYLRMGAYIGGEPAWDADLNTARTCWSCYPCHASIDAMPRTS